MSDLLTCARIIDEHGTVFVAVFIFHERLVGVMVVINDFGDGAVPTVAVGDRTMASFSFNWHDRVYLNRPEIQTAFWS